MKPVEIPVNKKFINYLERLKEYTDNFIIEYFQECNRFIREYEKFLKKDLEVKNE